MNDHARADAQVEIFTQPHCAPCRAVEAFLREHRVEYRLRDVTADPAALAAIADHGFMSTPVTRVGDRWLGGFNRRRLEEAMRESRLMP